MEELFAFIDEKLGEPPQNLDNYCCVKYQPMTDIVIDTQNMREWSRTFAIFKCKMRFGDYSDVKNTHCDNIPHPRG